VVLTRPAGAGPSDDKAARVHAMFSGIAARYDLMNALMTGGRDQAWRRRVARLAAPAAEDRVLDLATGTADLALAFLEVLAADALALPFPNATFGCVASAFLLRNLADLGQGLTEMRRVTQPGGSVVALEITQPTLPVWRDLFRLYFHYLVPALGALVSGDRGAYTYLPRSVERFVTPPELARLMRDVGLWDVKITRLGLGTVTIHVGRVP
jgi:demethylmenaquinone methyltransferase/2-methoxy-6-polyprenyl-1,4-benzoquinol methylase